MSTSTQSRDPAKRRRAYAFRVTDGDGLWGDIGARAHTQSEARKRCRAQLKRDEVEPRGSLLPSFTLTPIKPAP